MEKTSLDLILEFIDERIKWNEDLKEKDPKPSDIGRIEEAKCIRRYVESLVEKQRCPGCNEVDVDEMTEAMEESVNSEPILSFFCTGQPTIGAYSKDSLRNQFEAGMEYERNRQKKKVVDEVLEQYIEKELNNYYGIGLAQHEKCYSEDDMKNIARHFANFKK